MRPSQEMGWDIARRAEGQDLAKEGPCREGSIVGGGAERTVSHQGSATCQQTRVSAMVFSAMIGFLLTPAGGPLVRRCPKRELWGNLYRLVWGSGSGGSDL